MQIPNLVNLHSSSDRLIATVNLSAELPYFDGHFDNAPLLPGVCLVMWSNDWLADNFPAAYVFKSAKFLNPALPAHTLQLDVSIIKQTARIEISDLDTFETIASLVFESKDV